METAAIIAEYNPFHLGHAWQIAKIRQTLGDGCAVLAVMSGNFVQRGEPAIFDKWSRTRAALACGVDLVIELPYVYAAASAERFASGGVQLVQATGLDCALVFGSECGELGPLDELAGLLAKEPEGYRSLLHKYLDTGDSFPAARQKAVAEWTGNPVLAERLTESNNILAVEYLKAIKALPDCRLTPVTIRRQGQAYRAGVLENEGGSQVRGFASARAIRQVIAESLRRAPEPESQGDGFFSSAGLAGVCQKLLHDMPVASLAMVLERMKSGPGPLFLENFAPLIISLLRSQPIEQLEQIPGMAEGLARRLAAAAARPAGRADDEADYPSRMAILLAGSATRRFPQTRIQRALLSMMSGLRDQDLHLFDESGGPQYIRVIGFTRKGRYLLKIMRHAATRPVLMRGSDILEHNEPAFCRMAELDILATDLWMLAAGRTCGHDFDTPVVMG